MAFLILRGLWPKDEQGNMPLDRRWHGTPLASHDVPEHAVAAVEVGQTIADVAVFYRDDPSTVRRWAQQTSSVKIRLRAEQPLSAGFTCECRRPVQW